MIRLTEVGDVSKEQFEERFAQLRRTKNTYFVFVIEDITKQRIIGAATLLVERKFLRNCGKCGHIEDVVVDSSYRGKQLGLRLVELLKGVAKTLGCYKVVLNCSPKNIPFYEKCGFEKHEVQMAMYFPKQEVAERASAAPSTSTALPTHIARYVEAQVVEPTSPSKHAARL
ncbi:Glucosamine 6-phosphate N-acetyltransferase [Balamuthia mandrillaris]